MAAAASTFFFLLLLFLFPPPSLSIPDYEALVKLKSSFGPNPNLDSWVASSAPCGRRSPPWTGVVCARGIVVGLRLASMEISGKIDVEALGLLPGLRTISFVNNSFSGEIPDFRRVGALKSIFLSNNRFNGGIPDDHFGGMKSLKKLWLSHNNFSGNIPSSLSDLPHLMELHLGYNQFSGPIPNLQQPSLKSIDFSFNRLQGSIPESMNKFPSSSFAGNAALCGKKMKSDCTSITGDGKKSKVWLVMGVAAMGIILGVFILVLRGRENEMQFDVLEKETFHEPIDSYRRKPSGSSHKPDSTRRGSRHGKNTVGDLVIMNDIKGVFGLPDLMKAAAEVLSSGGLGSAYKAVLENGVSVVVKRLREMNRLNKDAFEGEIRRIGRLRHRNILAPLAYHVRKEEKLLITEFVPKGSLLYLLHGDRGICHAELNWPTRLKILQGVARGMGFLHSEFSAYEIPHGNLKSCNILLGSDYEPLLTDYAFYPLLNPTHAENSLFAFRAPEAKDRGVTPKSDVYCLGIVVLEVLTGKFPSSYLSNGNGGIDVVDWSRSAIAEKKETEFIDPEIAGSNDSLRQMKQLLRVGVACTEADPAVRLDMRDAIRRIEEISSYNVHTSAR